MLKRYLVSTLAITLVACGNGGPDPVGGPTGPNGNGGGGGIIISTAQGGHTGSGSNGGGANSGMPGELSLIVRDFRLYDANNPAGTNPDFENVPNTDEQGNPVGPNTYWGPWRDTEIVADQLVDHLPVYKHPDSTTVSTHGKQWFDQWFRNTEGVNTMQVIPVTLTKNSQGLYEYDSSRSGPLNRDGMFFPIDDGTPYATSFGNQTGKDASGRSHNFSFTVEIHTVFTYQGGEHFYFRGDDDVFVFIDDKLQINLGGIHGTDSKDVDIDKLGLTKGNTYNLDFFYAERHMVASDLLITTGLELSNNGDIPIL
jgi:fibro-slime domain-containing protein